MAGDTVAGAPTCSLVVLTYNRWDRTEKLLRSILDDDAGYGDVELVWVENGSFDDTPARFAAWLERHAGVFGRVHRHRNEANLGFIVGANQGMSIASGQSICLLNNDAVVTTGWLGRLRRLVNADDVAAVGPVSDGMPWNQSLDSRGSGVIEAPVAYGFCFLTTAATIDRVGLLDERYGRGVIEVEDWCERARHLGLTFRIDTDVVVWHDEPHASYTPRVNAMLHIRNRGLFEAKWGVGPYYWGERGTAARRFATTEVWVADPTGPAPVELETRLSKLDHDTELLVVKDYASPPAQTSGSEDWIRLARRDPRLNFVYVRPGWDSGAYLPDLHTANGRGESPMEARC